MTCLTEDVRQQRFHFNMMTALYMRSRIVTTSSMPRMSVSGRQRPPLPRDAISCFKVVTSLLRGT